MKKNKDLVELTRACKEVLRVAKKHAYLWDDVSLWGDEYNKDQGLALFHGFIAQDESYSLNVQRESDEFFFGGKNYYLGKRLDIDTAAQFMKDCGISAQKLKKRFYESLREPLGKYLAERYLKEKISAEQK